MKNITILSSIAINVHFTCFLSWVMALPSHRLWQSYKTNQKTEITALTMAAFTTHQQIHIAAFLKNLQIDFQKTAFRPIHQRCNRFIFCFNYSLSTQLNIITSARPADSTHLCTVIRTPTGAMIPIVGDLDSGKH